MCSFRGRGELWKNPSREHLRRTWRDVQTFTSGQTLQAVSKRTSREPFTHAGCRGEVDEGWQWGQPSEIQTTPEAFCHRSSGFQSRYYCFINLLACDFIDWMYKSHYKMLWPCTHIQMLIFPPISLDPAVWGAIVRYSWLQHMSALVYFGWCPLYIGGLRQGFNLHCSLCWLVTFPSSSSNSLTSLNLTGANHSQLEVYRKWLKL